MVTESDGVLITGASSGIGAALSRRLAEEGRRVHMAARSTDEMNRWVEQTRPVPGRLRTHECDLRSESSVRQLLDELGQEPAPPRVLVNNAGFGIYGRFDQVPPERARELFETNFFGPLRLTRGMVEWMKSGGGGRIVNVASGVSKNALPAMGSYAASKAALESISESLRLELAPFDITVQVVFPLRTETGFSGRARRFVPEDFSFPSGGPTQTPQQVARAIAEGMKHSRFRIHPHFATRFLGTLNEWSFRLANWILGVRETVRRTFD